MSAYKLTSTDHVIRTSDGAYIPNDLGNTDRRAFIAWLALGNVPTPADTPNPNDAIYAQINAIELATLTNRGAREGWLALILNQATTAGKTEAWLLDPVTGNPFYKKLKEVDTEIRTLRGQLK